MENSDLLNHGGKDRINADVRKSENGTIRDIAKPRQSLVPDGGALAWSIMVGSFITNGILFGYINSVGNVCNILGEQLKAQNDTDAESKSALVGSLTIGTTFLLSPVSGMLTDAMGIRQTAVLGGTIAATGMLISSFLTDKVFVLYFTHSIMYGFGAALAYTPSLTILGHYFDRYLGLVNGIVCAGSSVFTILILTLLQYITDHYGGNDSLPVVFRVQAVITLGVALCGFLFKPMKFPLVETPKQEGSIRSFWKTVINVEIFKKKKYLIWAFALPSALLGYFVPYVYFSKFIEEEFAGHDKNIAVKCMSATSLVGRLVVGFLSDLPKIDRIFLQQISFYAIGTLTIILPFVNRFWIVVVISLGMGFFDGWFIALIGPIAFDLCGAKCAAQAIGTLLGLASIPVSAGPPIAGAIYKVMKSYTIPFVLAGIPPIVGASLMFLIRYVDRKEKIKSRSTANGTTKHGVNDDGTQPIQLTEYSYAV